MKKTMGVVGALVVLMSGCGPESTEPEQSSALIQEGHQKAEIRDGQGFFSWYYADPEMTQLIGYSDGCNSNNDWGDVSVYEQRLLLWCSVP